MMSPLSFHCADCDISYRLGVETHAYLYVRQPWFNHYETVCPSCSQLYRVWRLNVASIIRLRHSNTRDDDPVALTVADFGDDPVIKLFREENGITELISRPLTPRQEKEVDWFIWQIEHDSDTP